MENEIKEYIAKLKKYNEYEESTKPVLTDEECIELFIELFEFGNEFIPPEVIEKHRQEKYERLKRERKKYTKN